MKVKDLIEKLEQVDPEREVILQKDAEGNGYSPLYGFWEGTYIAKTTWWGEAWLEELTSDLEHRGGFTEEDVRTDGEPAIFLEPIN